MVLPGKSDMIVLRADMDYTCGGHSSVCGRPAAGDDTLRPAPSPNNLAFAPGTKQVDVCSCLIARLARRTAPTPKIHYGATEIVRNTALLYRQSAAGCRVRTLGYGRVTIELF
jgi:hypothetical protein